MASLDFLQKGLLGAVLMTLAGIGAVNWLLIEVMGTDLVQVLSMGNAQLATALYVLAGVGGIPVLLRGLQKLMDRF